GYAAKRAARCWAGRVWRCWPRLQSGSPSGSSIEDAVESSIQYTRRPNACCARAGGLAGTVLSGHAMATSSMSEPLTLPQREYSPVAGFLSYLVPGLGQIVQGRVGKGLLFFFSLYFLFFFGQYLGDWRNVYIYQSEQKGGGQPRPRLLEAVADRARFF